MSHFSKPQHPVLPDTRTTPLAPSPVRPPKRRRPSEAEARQHAPQASQGIASPAKRVKIEPPAAPAPAATIESDAPPTAGAAGAGLSDAATTSRRARDAIHYQFGLEILLKHDELRLINQELAKCQTALEQLRRCHLIPYPVSCPTPAQVLDISSGKGAAVQNRPGEPVPKWAPPFGVTDGPYARHYAKWLIPDPMFDGVHPEWRDVSDPLRGRSLVEGRTTRNSFAEPSGYGKQRNGRGLPGQKLHALATGYSQPKDKAGPCVLKRSDGQTVKLVCIDCKRENFSSTQGFINHCRIAHRRDFKSHEEAAVQSGHPIELDESPVQPGDDKSSGTCAAPSAPALSSATAVHPLARSDMADQQVFASLLARLEDSMRQYGEGNLPGVSAIPRAETKPLPGDGSVKASSFVGSRETPHLSRLLGSKNFSGNLGELVAESKADNDDEYESASEASDDGEHMEGVKATNPAPGTQGSRAPCVMRVPAPVRATKSPAMSVATLAQAGVKAHPPVTYVPPPSPPGSVGKADNHSPPMIVDDDMDMDGDLSPNTLVSSNNAPSLVSDDGEFDDSDDGSSESDASDDSPDSDVAEITIEEIHEAPRSVRHHRSGSGATAATMRFKKHEKPPVTLVSPVENTVKGRRRGKAAR